MKDERQTSQKSWKWQNQNIKNMIRDISDLRIWYLMWNYGCMEQHSTFYKLYPYLDFSVKLSSKIATTFVFLTFLYYAVILVKNTGVLMLLSGVVKDRGGWPWPLGWFLAWLYIIWSNFCFQNFALDGFIKKLR